jgi:alkanesulfonate monooxygenase SsuD/methylene tetrahydromethanopterin reductase-like flavin-dependent oxidoreductase (luciferase family)
MVIATGIANIWARGPFTTTATQLTLSEAYPERFLLALGVSHGRPVEGIRGHHYQQPFAAMRRYLDRMDEAARAYRAEKPAAPPRVCLPRSGRGCSPWLLSGRRVLTLARHARPHREGSQCSRFRPLAPARAGRGLETNPDQARAITRRHISRYLDLPNYTNNGRRLGFTDDDFVGQGSDRLVDALVAWGDVETVGKCVKGRLDAGAP